MKTFHTVLVCAALGMFCLAVCAARAGEPAAKKMNVIFIIADDLGWSDNEAANLKLI